jgi:outer membrane protein OmpA-like peptidoglycan-associated protein
MPAVKRCLRYAMAVAAASIYMPCAALADPTADQIINALKPNAGALQGPTRGIRPLPQAGTPSPRSATPRGASHADDDRPSLDLTIEFQSGSANLTPAAVHTLDRLGKALASPELASDRFRIEGHTDTVGSPETNKPLSQHRADAVASYLEKTFGIDASRLEAVGVGEDDLLIATPDQTPEPRNRRVHIVNLSG